MAVELVCKKWREASAKWFEEWLSAQPADSVFCEWNVKVGAASCPEKVKNKQLKFVRSHIDGKSLLS
jgi:hypothetical protein